MGKFDVVLDYLVSKDDSLIRAAYPWSFRLDFNGSHREFFKDLFLKFGNDVWFFDMRQAEEDPCVDRYRERQQYLREYRA